MAWRGERVEKEEGFMNASRKMFNVMASNFLLPSTGSQTRLGKEESCQLTLQIFSATPGTGSSSSQGKRIRKKERKENAARVQLTRFPFPCVWSESITPSW
jgi:hypothetical protein